MSDAAREERAGGGVTPSETVSDAAREERAGGGVTPSEPVNDAAREELVAPTDIVAGDVIEDPARRRWITVREIMMLSDAADGAYSFYAGPDDRVTYEGSQLVKRRRR